MVGLEALEKQVHVLQAKRLHQDAIALCRQAVAENSQGNLARVLLAQALYQAGRLEEAEIEFLVIVREHPDLPAALANFGNLLHDLGRFGDALVFYERALSLAPQHPALLANMAVALEALGEPERAMATMRLSLELRPDHAPTECNFAFMQLRRGHFQAGWQAYEARLRLAEYPVAAYPPSRRWNGNPLDNQSVLLISEQGFGDTLQFARYAPMVVERGGRAILEVQPELVRLLSGMKGVTVLKRGAARPPYDLYCPMMSLPHVFGTTMGSIPSPQGYLEIDPELVATWRDRLNALSEAGTTLRVGLVWAGASRPEIPAANAIDRRRSIPLSQFATLIGIPGIQFVSLQKDTAAAQAERWPPDLKIINPMARVGDFTDTAAIVRCLDLVITVDTSIVHLAGALGKPVWMLSRADACWRWLRQRTDSPWYSSLRIFRQPRPGDWASVLADVHLALSSMARLQPP